MTKERKYALTRIESGDYLLPSNDGKTIWRIYRYIEDGSAGWAGYLWAAARFRGSFEKFALLSEVDPIETMARGDNWEHWSGPHRKRSEAIEDIL